MIADITIVCADRSHEGRVVKVATFKPGYRWEPGRMPGKSGFYFDGTWEMALPEWERGKTLAEKTRNGGAAVQMVGDDLAPKVRAHMGRTPGADQWRQRYSLTCRLCGLSVSVRDENLSPLLDRAAASGVSDIPLSVLAATL